MGEQSSMDWKPAAARVLMVPGKSLAMLWRTGQVWQPMGRPRGLARALRGREARIDAAAVDLRKVRRDWLDIVASGEIKFNIKDASLKPCQALPGTEVPWTTQG